MKRDAALFLSSLLFFLLAGFLYAWGPPAWFSKFPYSAGLRFLLSLDLYFLCCTFFFSCRTAFSRKATEPAFVKTFLISFAAIPVFAILAIRNLPIQVLQAFVNGIDIAGWLFLTLFSARKSARDISLFSAFFLLSGISLFVPAIPSILVFAARFIFLSIFSVKGFYLTQDRKSEAPILEPVDFRCFSERFALSRRETEVLSLLIAGKTNNEIAESLFISLSTVKTHIASIFEKTGARNRLEVSAMCRKS